MFMMMFIPIIAVVISLVIALLALQVLNARHQAEPKSRPQSTNTAAQTPTSQSETATVAPPALVPMAPDHDPMGLYKDLRTHMLRGIDKIFDQDAPAPEEWSVPRTREQIDPAVLREALGHLERMDQFRAQQMELQKLLNDPRSQLTDLSKNITSDPVLTAKVLKMANSSYFGFTQKLDSISHALMILGLQNVKNIMYREGLRGMFDAGSTHNKAAVAALWRHSNLVCICTQHFHDLFDGLNRGTLFTLGIVHDIGKLILMDIFQQSGKKAIIGGDYPMDILVSEEDQLFAINHTVIGGCTLEHWNFSDLMTRSVMMHHAPSFIDFDQIKLPPETLKYVLSLFLADQIARIFTDWNEETAHIYPLRISYYPLIDKKKLINKITDVNFLNQLQAAEMIAVAEHPLAGGKFAKRRLDQPA